MELVKVALLVAVCMSSANPAQGQLNVVRDGSTSVVNNTVIRVVNDLTTLSFQCTDMMGNVTWLVLPENSDLRVFDGTAKGDSNIEIQGSGSSIMLTISNRATLFRGLLKCSSTSGQVLNINVVPGDLGCARLSYNFLQTARFQTALNCSEERDPIWNILWRTSIGETRDYQPCPNDGEFSQGYALRNCLVNGSWANVVNISSCSTPVFESLSLQATQLKTNDDATISPAINEFIKSLLRATQPKSTNNTHFPRDLNLTNGMMESLLRVMMDRTSGSRFLDTAGVFSNLLHPSNIEGWQQLQEISGSVNMLRNVDSYGEFLATYRPSNATPVATAFTIRENYISYEVARMLGSSYNTITYPANMDEGVQVSISASLLTQLEVTAYVFILMPNIYSILPNPDLNTSVTTRIATNVMSAHLYRSTGPITSFIGEPITFNFKTQSLRSRNPTCVFLDPTLTTALTTGWSTGGLFTEITGISGAEFKQFDVMCSSTHLTSFAASVEETTMEFEITIPIYIGSAFIIISAVISIFTIMLSCILDTFRKYFLSGYLIHMSFAASVLCASIAFLAGITQGLGNDTYCQVVSGLLLYFYTAAFSWLFCELMLLVCFGPISRNWCVVVIIFILGWGLPAISTAVTAGLLDEDFGSTTQCWLFFDGSISSSVFLGFMVPKLVFVAGSIFMLTIGCCTTYKLSYQKIQPYVKKHAVRMLWFIWISTILLVALLSLAWVFLLLFVNAFATDLSLSQWIYMGASIVVGIWMFIFNAVTVIVTQRVDYDRLWAKKENVYVESDPGKGSGYEFMNMSSSVDLSGRRSNRNSVVVGPPSTFPTDNPAFSG